MGSPQPSRHRSSGPTAGRCPTSTTERGASRRTAKPKAHGHVQSPKPSWTTHAVAGLLADGSSLLRRPSRTFVQWSPFRQAGTDEGEQLPAHSGEGRAGFAPASRNHDVASVAHHFPGMCKHVPPWSMSRPNFRPIAVPDCCGRTTPPTARWCDCARQEAVRPAARSGGSRPRHRCSPTVMCT